jgi:hypothetical protein
LLLFGVMMSVAVIKAQGCKTPTEEDRYLPATKAGPFVEEPAAQAQEPQPDPGESDQPGAAVSSGADQPDGGDHDGSDAGAADASKWPEPDPEYLPATKSGGFIPRGGNGLEGLGTQHGGSGLEELGTKPQQQNPAPE